MQEVSRKEGESFENLLRRFNKKVQQSGILVTAKKKMYHEKPLSKRILKEQALRKKKRPPKY